MRSKSFSTLNEDQLQERLRLDYRVVMSMRSPIMSLAAYSNQDDLYVRQNPIYDEAHAHLATNYLVDYHIKTLVGPDRFSNKTTVHFDLLANGNYPFTQPSCYVVESEVPWSPVFKEGHPIYTHVEWERADGKLILGQFLIRVAMLLNFDDLPTDSRYVGWNAEAAKYWQTRYDRQPITPDLAYPMLPAVTSAPSLSSFISYLNKDEKQNKYQRQNWGVITDAELQTPESRTVDDLDTQSHQQNTGAPILGSVTKDTQCLVVFLCHSSDDKPAVRDLYNRLRSAAGYIAPWLDEEDLLPGQKWEAEIPKAVRASDVVIICLSHNSINKKGYVQKEIKYALDIADEQPEGTIFLIPVRLEDCELPERLKHLHCVNLRESRGFEKLVRSLKVSAEKLGIDTFRTEPNIYYRVGFKESEVSATRARTEHFYEFGNFRLYPNAQYLLRDNKSVALTPRQFTLLLLLVKHSGALLTPKHIKDGVWPEADVNQGSVAYTIHQLRVILEDNPNEPQFIETVRGHGYRFTSEVRESVRSNQH